MQGGVRIWRHYALGYSYSCIYFDANVFVLDGAYTPAGVVVLKVANLTLAETKKLMLI